MQENKNKIFVTGEKIINIDIEFISAEDIQKNNELLKCPRCSQLGRYYSRISNKKSGNARFGFYCPFCRETKWNFKLQHPVIKKW